MLDCNVILTLFAHYICLHGYIHFIYLFNSNTKYQDMYRIPQVSQKIQRYEFLLILPSPTLKKRAFGNILLDVASGEKPKAFFSLLNLCFSNSNIIRFYFSFLVFQSI